MRKTLAILLILVLVLGTMGLTACGGKAENEIWIGAVNAGYGVEWLKKTVQEFNEMQDEYVVVMNDCDSPNFNSKAEQQLKDPKSAENDIYLISEIWWKTNAKNLYFKPLDEVYSAMFNDDMTIEEAMRPENLAEAKVVDKNGEDHYYAINYETTNSGLIYNKTIAEYYESLSNWGSTPKMAQIKNGGTVDQLIMWMDRIAELSKTYYAFGDGTHYLDGTTAIVPSYNTGAAAKDLPNAKVGEQLPNVYPIVYAGMHSYWDAVINTWWAQSEGVEGYRSFFEYDSPLVYQQQGRLDALKALEKLQVNDRSVPGSVSMDHIQSQNEFLRGRAAIIPCGDWMYYESRNAADSWGTDFEMIYVPACNDNVKQRNIISSSDGGLCVIPNNDKVNYEGCIEFLKYLFSEQGCINYTSETGSLWGFDGYEGEETYASILKDAGEFSPFNEQVFDLVNNANGYVTKLPNDLDAPNAAFATTSGVAGEWPGQNLTYIREGTKTAQQIFDACISYVGEETPDHTPPEGETISQWDRWWNIVHVGISIDAEEDVD